MIWLTLQFVYCSGFASLLPGHHLRFSGLAEMPHKCLQVEEQHRAGDYYRGRLLGLEKVCVLTPC